MVFETEAGVCMNKLLCIGIILMLFMPTLARAKSYHIIVCGSGGEKVYEDKFQQWGTRLETVLNENLHVSEQSLFLLTEFGKEGHDSSKKTFIATMNIIKDRMNDDDTLFVYLIGHGSFYNNQAKFHIPGPDLVAQELDALLDTLPSKHTMIINASSGSAPFIPILSAEHRIVCVATKSGKEINATEFMEGFIEGMESGSADSDHDGRISLWEASHYATKQTANWYTREGLVSTEHALLDDNGDGVGTRLELPVDDANEKRDGAVAQHVYLRDFLFSARVPQDLIVDYTKAIEFVEELKQHKGDKQLEEYYRELEVLLLNAAKLRRTIRRYESVAGPES